MNKKDTGIAYVLWFFLGAAGAHNLYIGGKAKGIGIAQLVLACTIVGLIVSGPWAFVDAFLIPGRVKERNGEIGLPEMPPTVHHFHHYDKS